MYRLIVKCCVSLLTAALMVGNAQATLFDRGGGMIYDSFLNITWQQNWSQAAALSNVV